MTLHQLKIFSSVAKLLNVTRASAELHISQPSVSQQLKLLQEEYGAKLYQKDSRGIRLTEEGRFFLNKAASILLQLEKLKKRGCANLADGKAGSLTVGGSHSPSASFLPLILTAFKAAHPQVEVALRTDNSLMMEQLVQNSEVEIAVTTNASYSPSLIYKPCWQEEMMFLASPKHPLSKRRQLTLGELAKAPTVIIKKGYTGGLAKLLKQISARGLNLNIVMRCESPEAVKAAVKAEAGLGILYKGIVASDLKAGSLKSIRVPELDTKIDTFVIYHKEKPLSANAQAFLALLQQWPQQWSRRNRRIRDFLQVA